ncbi:multidrug transporter [Dissulfurirhabdus thermomarina]|uniref:Multidrug transporter n=1 Tax=Dissulfurirhabdus thermomarina TaxID=1765737 RepID=A0A6N9TLY3_DISTH|nr:DsrE family protein [Dissulfurirhabdus thermomarina]NDY42245.1 multidrug transporter [Dissulfurirhabdus thermomarina]NMX22976.1 multidrug transporter [Dissulfurirhabdus thermomarina]
MTEQEEKILYICTHADDDPEKAAMPFVMANAALSMDVKAVVVLQGQGAYLALKGYVEHMLPSGGFPPLPKLMSDFQALGGELRVCAPCIKERKIDKSELIEGAATIAAAELTVLAMEAKAVFNY